MGYGLASLERDVFIDSKILDRAPVEQWATLKERIDSLAKCYGRYDGRVLTILHLAANEGTLPHYLDRLEGFYHALPKTSSEQVIHPEFRIAPFLTDCYARLGISNDN